MLQSAPGLILNRLCREKGVWDVLRLLLGRNFVSGLCRLKYEYIKCLKKTVKVGFPAVRPAHRVMILAITCVMLSASILLTASFGGSERV